MKPYAQQRFTACITLRQWIALGLLLIICFSSLPAFASEERGTLTATVVLRKSADTKSKALQTLPKGDEVVLLSTSGSWYKVNYGKYTGFIQKKYVSVKKNSVLANAAAIADLGSAPGALRIGDSGTDVTKLQKALKILKYYDKNADGDYGAATTAAVLQYQQDKKLTADGVAGRETIKSIFGSCARTANINSTASATSTPAPSSSSASAKSASQNTVSSLKEIGTPPKATKEGASGTNVIKLQQALSLLGYYSGSIDGNYGEQTTNAVKKFQSKRNMKADGIAGASTIRVLFGGTKSASSSSSSSSASSKTPAKKTENLHWFDDDMTRKIPKNAKFTVKDVRTGKTFNAVRWSGSNHLDAEPASAEDTKTMKSIFGGAWSWNRRAILIQYNGHTYAASMSGMPHGTRTVSGNNFDGHFCIHFMGSKTHGTERVDEGHQSAVNSASRASW